jgi:hypothetical protein
LAGFTAPGTIGVEELKTYVQITDKTVKRLGEVTAEEALMAGLSCLKDFRKAWISCYGYWNPKEPVAVFQLRLARKGKI